MMSLLVFKETLKRIYGKYSLYLIPLVKFIVGFLTAWLINTNIGFMEELGGPFVPILFGLVASFLPYGVTAFLAGLLVLAHASQVSMEVTMILFVFMLVVMMLYYGFHPGDGYLLLLTPMMFFFHLPYVVPLIVGLSGSLVSIVPVCCGVCIYYIILYLQQNAGVLAGSSLPEMAERFIRIVQDVFGNELMWVMAAAFAAAVLVVFIIKNLTVDYSWSIAIIAGVIVQLAIIFIGDMRFNLPVSAGSMIIGILLSVLAALVYQFFVFAVDYTRTEYLQYEDDEYYYYVKAVPKIAVSAPDVKVQKIYSRKNMRRERKD